MQESMVAVAAPYRVSTALQLFSLFMKPLRALELEGCISSYVGSRIVDCRLACIASHCPWRRIMLDHGYCSCEYVELIL